MSMSCTLKIKNLNKLAITCKYNDIQYYFVSARMHVTICASCNDLLIIIYNYLIPCRVRISWGDGRITLSRKFRNPPRLTRFFHRYIRAGRYRIFITVFKVGTPINRSTTVNKFVRVR